MALLELSLEKTIFRLSCFLAVIYEFYGLGVDIMLPLPLNHIIVDSVLLVLFSTLTILSFRLKDPLKYLQYPFIIILTLGVAYFWVEAGGLNGGSIGYISMVVLIAIILVPNPPINYYAALLFLLMQSMFVILEIYRPEIFFDTAFLSLNSLPSTFLMLNAMSAAMVGSVKYMIDAERKRLNDSKLQLIENNKLIESKNLELKEKGDQIEKINLALEKRVTERTREILFQKRQIEEFTYLNAHKLRGAISRIVGLSALQKNELSKVEYEKLRDLIDQCAVEADDVLREITTKLNEESKRSLGK